MFYLITVLHVSSKNTTREIIQDSLTAREGTGQKGKEGKGREGKGRKWVVAVIFVLMKSDLECVCMCVYVKRRKSRTFICNLSNGVTILYTPIHVYYAILNTGPCNVK